MHTPLARLIRPQRRGVPLLAATAVVISAVVGLVLAPPAQAAAATTVTLSYGANPLTVGQPNATLTVSFKNSNTVPDQNTPQTLADISITPSCAVVAAAACTTANPGVFDLGDEARASGTGCPTGKFSLGAPDPSTGAVRVIRLAPEAIPAGGTCTLTITARVLSLPTDADPVAPGLQTIPVAAATTIVSGIPGSTVTSRGAGLATTITKTLPTLSTTASTATTGGTIRDVATVAGRSTPVAGATVTFRLFPPTDPGCAGTPALTSVRSVPTNSDTVTSADFRVTAAGTWRWVASYSGDANNEARTGVCGEPSENSIVTNSTCFGEIATIVGSDGDDTLTGTAGRDVIVARAGNDTISGGDGNDLICGGSDDDVISGGAGNDVLFGDSGRDQIRGGDGNDEILGGSGADSLSGDAGRDQLSGESGVDELRGGTGGDELSGGRSSDDLFGQAGRDFLTGGSGNDLLNGGSGTDEGIGGSGRDDFVSVERRSN